MQSVCKEVMKGFPIITAISFDHMKVKLELTDVGRPNGERKVKGRENQSTNSPSSKMEPREMDCLDKTWRYKCEVADSN